MRVPSAMMLALFNRVAARQLRRHFHGVRLLHGERLREAGGPLMVVMNHASWWDPLVALALAEATLAGRRHYAPMDAAALRQYGFFKRLGVFPIEMDTVRGAMEFLRAGAEVMRDEKNVLWVTAQGEFADVRVRPTVLKEGAGALVHRMERCVVLPVAMEFTFWDEKLPEALVICGEAIVVESGAAKTGAEWTQLFAERLEAAQDELKAMAIGRNASKFESVLKGEAGVGGVYEAWQRVRARVRGEKFDAEHGRIGRGR